MEDHHTTIARTAEEWEEALGRQIRELRLRENLTQAQLARRANLDRTTVVRIEQGEGATLRSLAQIARALDREEWLDAFAPPTPTVSPMELLREQKRHEKTRRVRARRPSPSTSS